MDDVGATAKPHDATFEVESHYEMASRGGFIIGLFTERRRAATPGMVALSPTTGERFTVDGIETLCNPGVHRCKNALLFRGRPTLAEVLDAFPVGSVVLLFKE
jgi:hypothetical protein